MTTSNEEPPDGGEILRTASWSETPQVMVPSGGNDKMAHASAVAEEGKAESANNNVKQFSCVAASKGLAADDVSSSGDNHAKTGAPLMIFPKEIVALADVVPPEVCKFLGSLGIFRCEDLASADRWHVANELFQWHKARPRAGAKETKERPLKFCQAQVYSWMARMNSLRQQQGLPALVTRNGPNSEDAPMKCDPNDVQSSLRCDSPMKAPGSKGGMPKDKSKKRKRGEKGEEKRKRRRVSTNLHGKKEMALAREMLSKSIDLSSILSPDECRLCAKFWIFSLQQLSSILMIKNDGPDQTNDKRGAEIEKERQNLRSQFIEEIRKWPDLLPKEKQSESESVSEDVGADGKFSGPQEGANESSDCAVKSAVVVRDTKTDAAEAIVVSWEERIRRKKRKEIEAGNKLLRADLSYKEQFALDGAISVLFPPQIIHFLDSLDPPITTAFGLLSAKKSENSYLLDLFLKWREKRKLAAIKPITLARHLISLSSRLNCALASIPPANKFTREFMGSSLVVLTGGAYDFIRECKITSDEVFLKTKTRDLAERLSRSREARGMTVLKGSGNVATISGWKTLVKDMNEADEELQKIAIAKIDLSVKGSDKSVLDLAETASDTDKMSSITSTIREVSDLKKPSAAEQSIPSSGCVATTNSKQVQRFDEKGHSLADNESSSSTLSLQGLLKPSQLKFLASVNIFTPEQLIRVDKSRPSQIVSDLIEWRRKRGFCEIQRQSCVKAIVDWTKKVEAKLERPGVDDKSASKQTEGKPVEAKIAANNGTSEGGNERGIGKPKGAKIAANDGTSEGGNERGIGTPKEVKIAANDASECANERDNSVRAKGEKEYHPGVLSEPRQSDPIDILSKTHREFLATQGITKAEQLLVTKSSVLADDFVKWREQRGLRVLKGYGAVSSISGWKSNVRNEAAKRRMPELVGLDHASRVGRKMTPRKGKSVATTSEAEDHRASPITHPRILMGLSRRDFTVCSRRHSIGGDTVLYDFNLSVRTKLEAESDKHTVYLTYGGARVQKNASRSEIRPTKLAAASEGCIAPEILPECDSQGVITGFFSAGSHQNMQTASDFRTEDHITFCSYGPGGGLIDLSSYCISPASVNGSINDIHAGLEHFISCHCCKPISESEDTLSCMLAFPHTEIGATEDEAAREAKAVASEAVAETTGVASGSTSRAQELSGNENNNDDFSASEAANVFLQQGNLDYRERQLLYLAEPIEKGQTVELISAGAPKQAKLTANTPQNDVYSLRRNILQRVIIVEMIRSLSLSEINDIVVFIHDKFFPRIASQMKQLLSGSSTEIANSGQDGNDTDSVRNWGFQQASALLASRRRLHFIAEIVSAQTSLLARRTSDHSLVASQNLECSGIRSRVEKLLWDKALLEKADYWTTWKGGNLFDVLRQEVTEETISLMPWKGKKPLDDSEWCALSLELLDCILKIFSKYVLTRHSASQQDLFRSIVQATNDAVKKLEGSKPTQTTKFRLLAVVDAAVSSAAGRRATNSEAESDGHPAYYSYRRLVEAVVQSPDEQQEALSKHCFNTESRSVPLASDTLVRGAKRIHYHPKSLPIFLRVLWPPLVRKGWCINAGRTPEDVAFSPPNASRKKRKVAPTTDADSATARKRTRTSRRLAEAGITLLPRNLKHIFLKFTNHVSKWSSSDFEFRTSTPVKDVVERFIDDICKRLDSDDEDRKQVLQAIGDSILECFDKMLPLILLPIERKCPRADGRKESGRYCERYGCEYLLRLLIVIPDVLCQSAVRTAERERLCEALEDLARYLSIHHSIVFDEGDHPPPEDYNIGTINSSRKVLALLQEASPGSEGADGATMLPDGEDDRTDSFSVVRDSDRSLLTDFTSYSTSQVQMCVAGLEDMRTSRRKGMVVGFPGFICLHCLKNGDESSKFFFSNPSSLATLPSIVANHVQKCQNCPDTVKRALSAKRQKHNHQKKDLKHGSQASFYSRLWKRLSKLQNADSPDCASINDGNAGEKLHGSATSDCESTEDFKSHLEIMRLNDLRLQDDMVSVFKTYYECLALGGKSWSTDAMPTNFTSEWLLKEACKGSK